MLAYLLGFCLLATVPEDAANKQAHEALIAWETGKDFIGLTEKELLAKLGEPTSKKPGLWEYWQPLGPGAHSFRWVRVVRFQNGKVGSAAMQERGVGCILIMPK